MSKKEIDIAAISAVFLNTDSNFPGNLSDLIRVTREEGQRLGDENGAIHLLVAGMLARSPKFDPNNIKPTMEWIKNELKSS